MKKSQKILFALTMAFDPNAGGVQRTTYKLGKYFTEAGLEVGYFSADYMGHKECEYGKLYHAHEKGGAENPDNMEELVKVLSVFQPDFVINQVPYVKPLRVTLANHKGNLDYVLLGCLRNSLFNFKSNAREVMQRELPSFVFRILDNPIGMYLVQKRHYFSHRNDLKSILDDHDRFVLLAPPNQEELNYFVGDYKQEKVLAIPNSIPEVFDDSFQKEKILLHVGRIVIHQKRSDLLLKVWEIIYEKLPEWEFHIVGEGPYFDSLQNEINVKKIPRVCLHGYQKPESYYKKAAIFMMPSAYEGFPNTILEAQSYGSVPFAFESYEALSWIVTDGKDACLIPPYEVNNMATEIVSLVKDNYKMNKMRQQALENAKRFTIDKVGQIWLDFFHSFKH